MYVTALKRFSIIIFISAFGLFAKAQQIHFIYLQTEAGQPFYVKMDNKVVSSSLTGYLIIPKLIDGDYQVSIGFPKNVFPEEKFQISINKKNEGFLLKNFGDKGWGLFNMQSYEVVMGGGKNATEVVAKNLQNDPFSKMLANVVKDSTILQKDAPIIEAPVIAKVDSAKVDSAKAEVIAQAPPPLRFSPALKILSKKNADGMEMIYIDHNEIKNDTIRIFIPAEKQLIKTAAENSIVQNEKSSTPQVKDTVSSTVDQPDSKVNKDPEPYFSHPVFLENINSIKNKDSAGLKKDDLVKPSANLAKDSMSKEPNEAKVVSQKDNIVVLPKVVEFSTVNSDCKAFATDEDFLKLRKKMASEDSDDNMIKIAKRTFHLKCFSVEQIKNLSFLFLTNEGKYRFFDLAYAFASDSDQYGTLQSQLTDSYYINRFRAMIHK